MLRVRLSILVVIVLGVSTALPAEEPTPEQIEFFEKSIRPLLVSHCSECHGEGRAKGGLSLTSGDAIRRGGDSGPAVVAGKPEESLLIEAVGHRGDIKMPPKQKLADAEIAALRRWVEIGAPWPAENADPKGASAPFAITPEQRSFWSFQPVRTAPLPAVKDESWPAGTIDRFVLERLEGVGLKPSPVADRRTLIRRLTFDLIGLPPSADEIEAFVADQSSYAWETLVDRLLASPRYGERWARHWLDVARFGEDQAHTFQARLYPNGYRYRDWVVRALNDDLPYDRFVMEQIVGDLLEGPESEKYDRQIALGYFALGPVYYADAGCAFKASLDELDDRVDTLARGFLGLTIACARCHDHKFDPISQQDYYALAGIFRSSSYREAPLVPAEVVQQYENGQKQLREAESGIRKFQERESARLSEITARNAAQYLTAAWRLADPPADAPPPNRGGIAREEGVHEFVLERWQKFLVAENRDKLPQLARWFELADKAMSLAAATDGKGVPSAVVEAALIFEATARSAFVARDDQERRYPRPELDKAHADLIAALVGQQGLCTIPRDRVEGLLDEPRKAELASLKRDVETAKEGAPPKFAFAHALVEGKAENMKLHVRGNPNRTGDEVPRRFLTILSKTEPALFTQGSGRLELARSIATPENPLTARVIVNRLWQQHFGRGIVGTPSNFGALGERPTHPDLLDYLAHQLVTQGWSLKRLHREILLSATYRQSSADSPANSAIDPDNRLLWRMNRRRLDVEAWRDALLSVSGSLDSAVGGPSGNLTSADFRRRTLYGAVSRHNLDGLLRLFDFPDPNITSERRTVTTVPLQQLFVLNSDFMVRQAKAVAARVTPASANDDVMRIHAAYRLLFGRAPNDFELRLGMEFLTAADSVETAEVAAAAGEPPTKTALSRWEQYAQVLLSANEFTFVD